MAEPSILRDALVYLGAAVVCVPVAKRLGLGSVLGYLIAGCVIGPWGLGFVTHVQSILHFAEFGVVLMLFLIGLELDLKRLMELRGPVFGGGSLQMAACGAAMGIALLGGGPELAGRARGRARAGAVVDGDRGADDERAQPAGAHQWVAAHSRCCCSRTSPRYR